MKKKLSALFLCLSLLAALIACSANNAATTPTAASGTGEVSDAPVDGIRVLDTGYTLSKLTPQANLYGGPNGLAFDNADNLYVGSVAGVSIFHVNTETGDADVYVGAPYGGADDIVFAPDGTMYWNAFFLGKVFKMDPDGKITVLAENLSGANALDLNDKGELYVTQVFFGDALWRIDTTGGMDNQLIGEGYGGLNGFEIGTDGYIYGPLWYQHQVVKVDPVTGKIVKVVADGFDTPCAVNFDSKGNLYALDTGTGDIFRINIDTGEKTLVATQKPHLDNLAIDSNDRIFFTNMNTNGVYELDASTGNIRTVTEDETAYPQGIAVATSDSGDTLYLADNFTYKTIDPSSGAIACPENGSRYVYTSSVSEDGAYVVMTGWNDHTIKVFNRATAAAEYTISDVPAPAGSYMLADGSILVLEAVSGRLVRITDRDASSAQVIAEGLEGPTCLAPAEAGDPAVYVTEYTGGKITKINYETGARTVVCNTLSGPEGIAVDPNGQLVVMDSLAKQLCKVDPATGAKTVILENLPVGLIGSSPLGPAASPIEGVAVSSAGNLYFTSPQNNAVYMLAKK